MKTKIRKPINTFSFKEIISGLLAQGFYSKKTNVEKAKKELQDILNDDMFWLVLSNVEKNNKNIITDSLTKIIGDQYNK